MFLDIKQLFSPNMIQKANISIYQKIKLSIYMSLYSIPWIIVNIFLQLKKETFLLFALSFLFVIPNICTSFYFTNEVVNFKKYRSVLQIIYMDSLKNGMFVVGALLFFFFDSYIILSLMKQYYMFPLIYITLFFTIVCATYFLYFQKTGVSIFIKSLNQGMFFSWRYVLLSISLFLLIMLWLSIGYFLQGVNLVIGNGLIWITIAKLIERRIKKTTDK